MKNCPNCKANLKENVRFANDAPDLFLVKLTPEGTLEYLDIPCDIDGNFYCHKCGEDLPLDEIQVIKLLSA
jgi:hypothetical protein